MRKIAAIVAPFLVLVGIAGFSQSALADEGTHTFRGIVSGLNAKTMTFTLETAHSGNVKVTLDSGTQLTDKDGSVRHFSDLKNGERIKIKGDFSDTANVVDNVNTLRLNHD